MQPKMTHRIRLNSLPHQGAVTGEGKSIMCVYWIWSIVALMKMYCLCGQSGKKKIGLFCSAEYILGLIDEIKLFKKNSICRIFSRIISTYWSSYYSTTDHHECGRYSIFRINEQLNAIQSDFKQYTYATLSKLLDLFATNIFVSVT